MMTPQLQAALNLVRKGFHVFPTRAGAKAPPLVRDWPSVASSDEAQTRELWSTVGEEANPAVHCSGLLVVDVDVAKGGPESLKILDIMTDGLPATLTARTPSGGLHLYYRLPDGHPGVSNSVSALGKGLDVRSTGGYVLAPGAATPTGAYTWENDLDVAPAPQWLVDRCGLGAARVPADRSNDALEPDQSLARAKAMSLLASTPVPQEGERNLALYKFVCRVRELYGLDAESATDIGMAFADRCGLGEEESRATIASAIRGAKNAAGSKGVLSDDFPVIERPVDVPERPRKGPKSLDEVAEGNGTALYLIKGLLSLRSYTVMYGPPGGGKTFVALDIAHHVAAGEEWFGRRVRQGAVLYLAYEGAGGLKNRAKALKAHYGESGLPMFIDAAAYNLREQSGRAALGETIAQLPEKPKLIVIDTLAHALCGGDENSAQDVSAFGSAVQALIESTGACVIVIHHPRKSGDGGPRGSSALHGAIDSELEVKDGHITATKQRDMEIGNSIGFRLVPIQVDMDEDGDIVTSCYVQEGEGDRPAAPTAKLSPKTARFWHALCTMSPNNEPVTVAQLAEECADILPEAGSSRTTRINECVRDLMQAGYVDKAGRGMTATITRKLR